MNQEAKAFCGNTTLRLGDCTVCINIPWTISCSACHLLLGYWSFTRSLQLVFVHSILQRVMPYFEMRGT